MNDLEQIQQFAVGAVTLAATRNQAVRAEVLKVGDAVRVLIKPDYGDVKVHTGVIVGFEPFASKPTIIVAYIEVEYSKAEMKMLYFGGDEKQKAEILAAPEGYQIEVERQRVLDWFDAEQRKAEAQIDEIKAKRAYFIRYFGSVMSEVPAQIEA